MKKAYVDSRHGQVHLRYTKASIPPGARPVVCLHPTPYSGLFFNTLTPLLAVERSVISPDYPGYGGSDAGPALPSITEFAEAMCDALSKSGIDGPFDLFGFHTGCLVAVEMSLINPDIVGRMVLVDVPYFDAQKRKELHAVMTRPPEFTTDVTCLEKAWERNVSSRWDVQPLSRSLEIFAEELRAGERVNRGFHAAFSYCCEERFAAVTRPTLVIATQSSLLEPSQVAAGLIPGCQFQECPNVRAPAMETGTEEIAALTTDFLETK